MQFLTKLSLLIVTHSQLTYLPIVLLYCSPEVYRQEPYNEKVDVYSLGVMLYELFTRSLLVFTHVNSTKMKGVRSAGASKQLSQFSCKFLRSVIAIDYRP